jgi:hypothetical protein
MPSNVTWFERLMYVAVLLGLIDIYITFRREQMAFPSAEAWIMIVVAAILTALYVWLIWLVARKHKGWVRYVLLVLFLLTVAAALVSLPSDLREHPVEFANNILQCIAEGVALFLAFTGNARPWFQRGVAA